jgi:flagellar protein FlaI
MELKGILYKKLKKEKVEFPQVEIKRPEKVFEFPKIKDITKVNITYPLLEPFVFANIRWDEKERALIYRIIEPELSQKEKDMLKKINEGVIELIEVSLSAIKDTRKVVEYLGEQVKKVIEDLGLKLTPEQYRKFMYYIYRNFVGMSEIEPLLLDPFIEDISCDGVNVPLYIIHRKFGSLKTNLIFQDIDTLRELIIKMAEKCGRYVSYAEPILAGILPDGSRVSATLAPDVATRGGAFTIRKFTERPFSPIDQIELKTASSEVLAYFWQILQNKLSVLIAGGTATGKTSFLNSICMFIPREAKIISIEDTRELRLVHEHWVPGLARVGFGLPLPTGVKYGEVSLFDLLKKVSDRIQIMLLLVKLEELKPMLCFKVCHPAILA